MLFFQQSSNRKTKRLYNKSFFSKPFTIHHLINTSILKSSFYRDLTIMVLLSSLRVYIKALIKNSNWMDFVNPTPFNAFKFKTQLKKNFFHKLLITQINNCMQNNKTRSITISEFLDETRIHHWWGFLYGLCFKWIILERGFFFFLRKKLQKNIIRIENVDKLTTDS